MVLVSCNWSNYHAARNIPIIQLLWAAENAQAGAMSLMFLQLQSSHFLLKRCHCRQTHPAKSTITLIRGIFSLLFRWDPAWDSKCRACFTGWKAAQINSSKSTIDRWHFTHHLIDIYYEGNSACELRVSSYDISSMKVGGLFKNTWKSLITMTTKKRGWQTLRI
jgi:hypothetical protein